MSRNSFIYFILILTLMGCEKNDQLDDQLEIQQLNMNDLKRIIVEKDKRIEELTEAVIEQETIQLQTEKVRQEYPWLNKLNKNTKWDKIVIYRYENDPAMITVEDPLFLESINELLFNMRLETERSYPSGYQTDIDTYTYEFIEGDQKYAINIVDRGIIEAGHSQLYFKVDKDIHQLGSAFMPKRTFIQHDGLIAKMAASGAVKRGEQYVQLSSFRVQSRIAPLIEAERLENQPKQIGEKIECYVFYYFGEELVMDVYKDYLKLASTESEEWYYYKDAEYVFTLETG